MKKSFKILSLFFVLITAVLMSCSDKSDDATPKITAPVGKIVAKIGGATFEGVGGAQVYNNQIILAGNSTTETLSIIITTGAKVGTYIVKGATLGTTPDAEINYSSGLTLYSSVFGTNGEKEGTVTITELDETNKTISGTFSSKVFLNGSAKEIVDGSFNKLPYVTAATSTLTAKIDGTAFTATTTVSQHGQGVIVLNGQTLNDSKIVLLSFSDTIVPGNYPIGELGDDVFGIYTVNSDSFESSSGTLKITKHDKTLKRVEGTFSFQAKSFDGSTAHNLTEGTFALSYF